MFSGVWKTLYPYVEVEGMPVGGKVPSGVSNVTLTVYLGNSYILAVELRFSFGCSMMGNDSEWINVLFEEYSFVLRWECEGCFPSDCDPCLHGYCQWGACVCEDNWAMANCDINFVFPRQLCPGEDFVVSYFLPQVINDFGVTNSMVIALSRTLDILEWRWASSTGVDPDLTMENITMTQIFTPFLVPGFYHLYLLSVDSEVYFDTFEVLDYPTCWGDITSSCGEGSGNTCHAETGNGVCSGDNTCVCSGGHYWFDCSRGCSAYSSVIGSSEGTINSDAYYNDSIPSESFSQIHFLNGIICRWFVDASSSSSKYDELEVLIHFTAFLGESLSFYYATEDGQYGDFIVSFVTDIQDRLVVINSPRMLVEFSTSPQNSARGFSLTFHARKKPLSPAERGMIFGIASLLFLLLLCACCVGVFLFARQRRRAAQASLRVGAETIAIMSIEEIDKTKMPRDDSCMLQGLSLDKEKLDFGLGSELCPVGQEVTDDIELRNSSSHCMPYCMYIPEENPVVDLSCVPGKGCVPSRSSIHVHVHFRLKYTTHFEHPIKIEFGSGTKSCSTWIQIKVEGAISEWLDPEEVNVDPEPLASGSFGSVYRGQYRSQILAVKIMTQQKDIRAFRKEMSIMNRLHHPCIVKFIGASCIPDKLCVCSEFIQNGSLKRFLKSDKEMVYPLHLKFAYNIAQAMEYLHLNNVLYRDLKCDNVLLVSLDLHAPVSCKLTDFGTSRDVEDAGKVMDFTTGVGTPTFMAPELFDRLPYNHKADVYSFGICLWELWTRSDPWHGCVFWDIPIKVAAGVRPVFPPDCPTEWINVTQQCWATDPKNRPSFSNVVPQLASLLSAHSTL
ncbi:serine/threonine-protein kinase STY8 [Pelomyxa schiedti]|nr:serine/threonine-protein kinase STY8 [Pelomyxa schiedti]